MDITRKKKEEEELTRSKSKTKDAHNLRQIIRLIIVKELFEKLTAKVPAALYQFEINEAGKMYFPYISSGIKDVNSGFDVELLKENAESAFATVHPEDVHSLLSSIELSKNNLTDWEFEYRSILYGNKLVWTKGKSSPEKKPDGTIVWYGYLQDVTKHKQVEENLKLLESVITNTNDAIMITDAEPFDEPGPKIVYVNEAFTKMTGYTKTEVIGKSPRILQGPESDMEELKRMKESMKKWEPCEITIVNYKKNGEKYNGSLKVNFKTNGKWEWILSADEVLRKIHIPSF